MSAVRLGKAGAIAALLLAAGLPWGRPASAATAPPALHHAFQVQGGKAFPALKCPRPPRNPPAAARPGLSGPPPAGTEEEELLAAQEASRELEQQALRPPTADELREGLPDEAWLRVLHRRLQDASARGVARVGIWGGSHMAAEFFVAELREQMQARYGAGGAGHVNLLYGLPGIRLPVQALCRHGKWQKSLAPRVSSIAPIAAGLGLFSLAARERPASIELDPGAAASGNVARSLTVHYLRQPGGGRMEVRVDDARLAEIDTSGETAIGSVRVHAPAGLSRLKLTALGPGPLELLGVFADAGRGLVVDNFGITGASGSFWTTVRSDLLRQASEQRPYDLVMLAYGTNDVTGPHWDAPAYRQRFEATLEAMRRAMPEAMCVLITPGDRVTRSRVQRAPPAADPRASRSMPIRYDLRTYPERHREASLIQREAGRQHQCMAWDLSMEMRQAGGAYALMQRDPPWVARDLIHLTPLGYREMARLFLGWLRM